jgi:glycogen(starch) synthase
MKIIYWTPLFWPDIGGIETLAMKFLPAIRNQGYEIVAVTSHGSFKLPEKTYYNDIPVYRYPILTTLASNNLKQLIKVLQHISNLKQTFKPDLIHISFGVPSIAYFHLKTMHIHTTPTIVSVYPDLSCSSDSPNTVLGEILGKADWITSDSKATLHKAIQKFPEISGKSSVIYNGIDIPKIEPVNLNFKEPHIVCLGRLVNQKGFDLVITAFVQVLKYFPNAYLTIAGDGPARNSLEQQANKLGLNEKIHFPGKIASEEIAVLINKATVVVISSCDHDSSPVVALEAAQMARPVVASRVGGIPELVLHQRTGLLVENKNITAFADAISFLLDNPVMAQQMGFAARKRAIEVFSLERYIDAYDNLYRKIYSNFLNRQVAPVERIYGT